MEALNLIPIFLQRVLPRLALLRAGQDVVASFGRDKRNGVLFGCIFEESGLLEFGNGYPFGLTRLQAFYDYLF